MNGNHSLVSYYQTAFLSTIHPTDSHLFIFSLLFICLGRKFFLDPSHDPSRVLIHFSAQSNVNNRRKCHAPTNFTPFVVEFIEDIKVYW